MRRALAGTLVVLLPFVAAWRDGRALAGWTLMQAGLPAAAARAYADPEARGVALYRAGRWDAAAEAFAADPALAYDQGNALARAGRLIEAVRAYDAAIVRQPDDEDARFNRALAARLAAASGAAVAFPDDRAAKDRENRGGRTGDLVENGGRADGHGEAGGDAGAASAGSQGRGSVDSLRQATPNRPEESGGQRGFGAAGAAEGAGRTGDVLASVARDVAARYRRLPRMLQARSVQPTEAWLGTMPDDPGAFLKLRLRAEQARRRRAEAAR